MVVGVLLAARASGATQDAVNENSVLQFLRELQRAVASDDRKAVAALMHYPLTVWAAGVRIPIPDAQALHRYYDAVFSPALKDAIALAQLPRTGRPAPAVAVSITDSGAVVHENTITIDRVGGRLKVTRISAPLKPIDRPRAAGAPPKSPSPREPQRVVMGLRTVRLSGYLLDGGRDSYVIWADRKQLLEVRVTGVRERDVVARIVEVKTRTPVDARAAEGTRTWIGRVPESGEYRIDVVRLARGREPLPYGLTLRLR
jgi:hypothetical protein